jgi:3-hydroxybutyryl-CoA dehydrogenase
MMRPNGSAAAAEAGIQRAGVIGGGTMGHGIAQALALAGIETRITDADARALGAVRDRIAANLDGGVRRGKVSAADAEATLARISAVPTVSDAAAGAELVVEAVVEDLDVKRRLFAELDAIAAADALLASNTSSLSIGRIAAATRHPERVVGMHFFNPVHVMRLVEVVTHDGVGTWAVDRARAVVAAMAKTSIVVRDTPGFASSRLGIALGLEAMRMLESGVASAEDIDTAMVLGYGHPMGPLRVSDLVGLDVRLTIAEYLHAQLNAPHFAPPAILREKVRAGELGRKTGKGFYEWPPHRSSE